MGQSWGVDGYLGGYAGYLGPLPFPQLEAAKHLVMRRNWPGLRKYLLDVRAALQMLPDFLGEIEHPVATDGYDWLRGYRFGNDAGEVLILVSGYSMTMTAVFFKGDVSGSGALDIVARFEREIKVFYMSRAILVLQQTATAASGR